MSHTNVLHTHENRNRSGPSRLSEGPANPQHRTYLRNDRLILRELMKAIEQRRISLRVSEVCVGAQISAPTFYLHYRNCDDALAKYEQRLTVEFAMDASRRVRLEQMRVATPQNKRVVIRALLGVVRKHRFYFWAMCRNSNMYLLHKMIDYLRVELVGEAMNDRTFAVYRGAVGALIAEWVVETRADERLAATYAKYIEQVRPMRCGW